MKQASIPLRKLQKDYLAGLLAGNREEARHLVAEALALMGYNEFYDRFLIPTLRAIGDGWQAGRISVASEHRATAIVRENLSWIRGLIPKRDPLGLRCIASSVAGDQHDLALRIFGDLLMFDGWEVDFLGANTPTPELVRFARTRKPHLFAISATMASLRPALKSCLEELSWKFPGAQILVGGSASREAGFTAEHVHHQAAEGLAASLEKVRQLFKLENRSLTLSQYLKHLGRKVQELRKARGWSQSELAALAELDRTYLSSLENGKQNLSLAVAYRIAAALQVPLVSLLGESMESPFL